jgi:hypothetical protein
MAEEMQRPGTVTCRSPPGVPRAGRVLWLSPAYLGCGLGQLLCTLTKPDPQLSDRLFNLDPLVEDEHAQRLPDTDMAGLVSLDRRAAFLPSIRWSVPMAGRLFSRGHTRRNLFPCLALRSAVRAPTLLWCCAPSVAVRLTRDGRSSNAGPGGRMGAGTCCRSVPSVRRASSGSGCAETGWTGASPEMTRGSCDARLDNQEAWLGFQARSVEGAG